MWRYDETVNITLETFRTVLKLMEDFPGFTFSQSQASCYRIVERYDKALLAKIAEKVKDNRWEVSAGSWTETDKNLPSGESLARHILYTKQYINKLFGIPMEAQRLDFEPDTFGHSAQVPEILAAGGVDFYYFCRGHDKKPEIFNWRAPSGRSVLAYREPLWYNKELTAGYFTEVPAFCKRNGVADMLMVYGIGDHGGGPTRRDLKRLVDMMGWTLFPRIVFSTYHRYFDTIKGRDFPVVEGELNFIFNGCYTSQSRIKAFNRISEAALYEAEALAALAPCGHVDKSLFAEAWQHVLFNQFHDIIPGSCVIDSREHALGLYQEALAVANSQKGIACYAIANIVDTSAVGLTDFDASVSEGAGVGYFVEKGHGLGRVERGRGIRRGYLLFNLAGTREDVSTITMWDWPGDLSGLHITDSAGSAVPHQVLEGPIDYWAHKRVNIAVSCSIPPLGWKLIIVDEKDHDVSITPPQNDPRVDKPYEFILENEYLRADIDPASGKIKNLTDKRTRQSLTIDAGFYGLTESHMWGSSWVVSRYKNDIEDCIAHSIDWINNGPLRQVAQVNATYKGSKISYTLSLDKGAEHVAVSAEVDWLTHGNADIGVPQLQFMANYNAEKFLYDIPFGNITRAAMDYDVPALSYACALPQVGPALAIISRDKYGYRCRNDSMALTLIRSTYNPDPYPELCRHNFNFYIAMPKKATPNYVGALAKRLCHPAFCHSVTSNKGALPPEYSMLECDGAISCIKPAEDDSGDIIIRLYDDISAARMLSVKFKTAVAKAHACDLTEKKLADLSVNGSTVLAPIAKNGVVTIRVSMG